MDLFSAINDCLFGGPPEKMTSSTPAKIRGDNEYKDYPSKRSDQDISADIVALFRNADCITPQLSKEVNDLVGPQGWTENIAKAVLAALETIIKHGRDKVGGALNECIARAEEEAKSCFQFAKDHPYLTAGFVTIVAIGVLVFMAPWVVEALGFGELGPIAGMSPSLYYQHRKTRSLTGTAL